MSLSISIFSPSKELDKSPIDTAITTLAVNTEVERRMGRLPSGPALDITFMLPYKEEKPPFEGMRMGGFSEENKTLFFESAVPAHIVYSSNASRYVSAVLQDAIDNADEYFKSCNILFNKQRWHHAIQSITGTTSAQTRH